MWWNVERIKSFFFDIVELGLIVHLVAEMNTCRDTQAFVGKIAAQISQFIVPGPKFLETSTMPDIAKSDISPNLDRDKMFNELWWLNYSVRVLALVQLEIHSLEEKL